MDITDISHSQEIYTVTRLNREVRLVLEGSFNTFWIEGEISNFAAPQSGHWYFSLKDSQAQIRCAMFKPQNRRLTFTPKDGMHVLVRANVSLFEGRGEFQILVEFMEEAGLGKLQQAFEALKKRLQAAGLFATDRKKRLPLFPRKIGVATSPTGAAIRDILHVLNHRFACVPIIIYPTLVQGELAANQIVNAIQTANARKECDVLILARGGGSLEDLWPFNEEKVAHAIYQSEIPTIAGIGHEIDFTIADFVADVRAPTPSAAAALAVPDKLELLNQLQQKQGQYHRWIKQYLQQRNQQLVWATKQLNQQHPQKRLHDKNQQLDLYQAALFRLQEKLHIYLQNKCRELQGELLLLSPLQRIQFLQQKLKLHQQTLITNIQKLLEIRKKALSNHAAKLDALSPLAILKRGFSITTTQQNQIIMDKKQIKKGDEIKVRISNAVLDCTINHIN